MFTSQWQAKRFLVEEIVAQAAKEGHPLSENERWMLSFSESDSTFVVDHDRVAELSAEIPDDEYEDKITGLIERACAEAAGSRPEAVALYKEAFTVLNQGDHYLSIMLARGLSRWLRPWWAFWR